MKNKVVKKFLAGILILAIAVLGIVYIPDRVQASNSVVKYQKVSNEDFKGYIDEHVAPTYSSSDNTGYLFAGWYETDSNDSPILSSDGITKDVYAKFVPAYLSGIACQVDINNDSSTRNLRVVSLVDSMNYQAVGFNVYGRYDKDSDGTNETEWTMYTYSSDPENPNKAQSEKVYRGLYAGELLKEPKDVFGADAEGFYFTTVSITGLGEKTNSNTGITIDFRDATMAVQPYWITLDGTYVEGMGEFNRVNDYEAGIVNISVNIKNADKIAAGLLSITYDKDNFTFLEAECGRVFGEMKCKEYESSEQIRCIGNVEDISDNTGNPNDVFVNLRFTKTTANELELGTAEFSVNIIDSFFDIEEKKASADAWDVWY